VKPTVLQSFRHRARVVSLVVFVWASIVPVEGISTGSARLKNQPVISVGILNYANVGRECLRASERQAAALFARVGVQIAWSEYSGKRLLVPSGKPAPDFSVRIVHASRLLRARRISNTDALGQSIMAPGTEGTIRGRIANVFYDQVEHVSMLWGLLPRGVLAYAIAHELGHLLGARHSRRGIMKGSWTLRDLRLASRGELRFLPAQAAALQRAARSLRKNHALTVTAQR
jgi:hypothetical protein